MNVDGRLSAGTSEAQPDIDLNVPTLLDGGEDDVVDVGGGGGGVVRLGRAPALLRLLRSFIKLVSLVVLLYC